MEQLSVNKNAVLGEALKNAIDLYGLKRRDVEEILGVSKSQLKIMQDSGIDPSSNAGQLSAYFIRVIRGISAMTGEDESIAHQWLTTENYAFSGLTPIERMKSIDGLISVLQYCDAFRGKL
ncbi:hypothetical protein A3715_14050 [Oleiphilus sp. HI0009]|nr:hypothetical protein A3715_14050 [Oleiphilus sp. HI0009]